jgi:TctA family transporter
VILQSLQALFSANLLPAVLLGVALGFVAGIVPGIGGRIGLLLALPLALLFSPLGGAVFLIALHAVVHTSGSITPIAYGLPTSASEAATALDGFQLQRKGKGAEALGASLSASSVGGVLGALVFMAAAPVARPVIGSLGAPEFLVLSLLGLALVSSLSDRQPSAGLAVAALGVLASTVGIDALTAQARYTFGRLELWDGLDTISVIGGLFVIPEMLALAGSADDRRLPPTVAELPRMLSGMLETFRHKMVLLRSTIIGIVVGIMPGAGSSIAVWIAYADASARQGGDVPFGQGAIAGVVAPEAANNAKEGGALIPTVFLGIPGSSSMAILLGGFAMLGLDVGPSMLTTQLPTAMTFGWTVILANLVTIPLFLLVVPCLVRFTGIRPKAIAAFALVAVATAAVGTANDPLDLPQFAAGGMLGVALYLAGLPRAPFLLGFIIGPMVENSLGKTMQVFGPEAALRPGVLILGAALLIVLWRLRRPREGAQGVTRRSRPMAFATLAGMALVGLAAIVAALRFEGTSKIAPIVAAAILVAAALFTLLRVGREPPGPSPSMSPGMGLAFSLLLAAVPLIGLMPASLGFLALVRRTYAERWLWLPAILAAVAVFQTLMVEGLIGSPLGFGVFGAGIFR